MSDIFRKVDQACERWNVANMGCLLTLFAVIFVLLVVTIVFPGTPITHGPIDEAELRARSLEVPLDPE